MLVCQLPYYAVIRITGLGLYICGQKQNFMIVSLSCNSLDWVQYLDLVTEVARCGYVWWWGDRMLITRHVW